MGFLVAIVMVAWLAAMVGALYVAIEVNGWIGSPLAAVILVLGLGAMFQGAIEKGRKGPCVQYETQMHYNAATKTMMPARVCVLRGEWVEQ